MLNARIVVVVCLLTILAGFILTETLGATSSELTTGKMLQPTWAEIGYSLSPD